MADLSLLSLFSNSPVFTPVGMEEYRFINENGLGGWLLSKSDIQLTPELREHCARLSKNNFIRYEIYREELTQLLKVFPEVVPIKGMSLIPRIYQNSTLRCVSDIDLYYPGDFKKIRQYFFEQGFSISDDRWEANEFKFVATKLINGIEVPFEIHQKLLWKSEAEWQFMKDHSLEFQKLIPEDELIYLCGHLAHQHTFLSLNWLIDIALLVQAQQGWDQKRIDELLMKCPLSNSLSVCLWACEKYFGLKLPNELKPYLKKDFKNKFIQKLIDQNFLKNPYHYRLKYYLIKHLIKDSLLNSFLYDYLWLKYKIKGELFHD
jgi:hypothetical protein